jgi:hypothetical protein
MTDAVAVAEVYVTRKCGHPAGQADCAPIAWHDGDLLDAFLAGSAWAGCAAILPTSNQATSIV